MQHTPSRSRSVAVVGAGPAGTTLALGLLQHGCAVTLVSDRTAEEIRTGTVMSSQITFESALEVEASLGVTDLLPLSPAGPDVLRHPAARRLDRGVRRTPGHPARSVDLRLKVPALLEEIERLGGKVVVRSAGVEDVEDLARTHDLVVVSTGRGAWSSCSGPTPTTRRTTPRSGSRR